MSDPVPDLPIPRDFQARYIAALRDLAAGRLDLGGGRVWITTPEGREMAAKLLRDHEERRR